MWEGGAAEKAGTERERWAGGWVGPTQELSPPRRSVSENRCQRGRRQTVPLPEFCDSGGESSFLTRPAPPAAPGVGFVANGGAGTTLVWWVPPAHPHTFITLSRSVPAPPLSPCLALYPMLQTLSSNALSSKSRRGGESGDGEEKAGGRVGGPDAGAFSAAPGRCRKHQAISQKPNFG